MVFFLLNHASENVNIPIPKTTGNKMSNIIYIQSFRSLRRV